MNGEEELFWVRVFDPKGPENVKGKRFRSQVMNARNLLLLVRRSDNVDIVSLSDGMVLRKTHRSAMPWQLQDDLLRRMLVANGTFPIVHDDPEYQI